MTHNKSGIATGVRSVQQHRHICRQRERQGKLRRFWNKLVFIWRQGLAEQKGLFNGNQAQFNFVFEILSRLTWWIRWDRLGFTCTLWIMTTQTTPADVLETSPSWGPWRNFSGRTTDVFWNRVGRRVCIFNKKNTLKNSYAKYSCDYILMLYVFTPILQRKSVNWYLCSINWKIFIMFF